MSSSSRLSAAENEFSAEDTIISIVPNVNHPIFRFISGTFGPLESGIPCDVPLWLAVTLRKRSKCVIRMPNWMSVGNLENVVNHERSEQSLGKLPFHYLEISHLLMNNAHEDIQEPEKVSALLQDLEQIRMDRIRMGIANIAETVKQDQSVVSTSLNNVGALEILAMKDFFLGSLDAFLWLRPPEDANREIESSRSGAGQRRTIAETTTGNGVGEYDTPMQAAAGANGAGPTRKLRKFRDT
jgi:GINS complex subunit 2